MKKLKELVTTILFSIVFVIAICGLVKLIDVKAEDTYGKITLKKTAVANNDRTAKVTLELQTNKLKQTTTDIIILMDRSGSMSKTICTKYNENKTRCLESDYRLTIAKEQAKELIKQVLPANNSGNVKIGVVTFGTNYEKRYSTQTYSEMTSNQQTALNMITNIQLTNNNGTNVQAGLEAARILFNSSTATNKIIVLISDGEPTYFTLSSGLTCGDGNEDDLDYWDPEECYDSKLIPSTAAKKVADELKSSKYGVEIYAVGYGDSTGKLAEFLTESIASKSTSEKKYEYNATDTEGLKSAISSIATNIKSILATDAKVEDTIPATFELTEEAITSLQTTYGDKIKITTNDDGTTTIVVNYKEISSLEGTYKIEYTVKAKDEYNGAMYTNKEAIFTATATEDNTFYQNKNIEEKFDKPVVAIAPVTKDDDLTNQNYLEGNTYTIKKDTILLNDIVKEELDKIVIQSRPNMTIPESTVTYDIVIDSVSCGTAKIENGDIVYTALEGCAGNPTIDYHVISNVSIYEYDGVSLKQNQYSVTSIAYKGENTYEKSSTITLSVDRVPVTYEVQYLEQNTNKELVRTKIVSGYKNRDKVTETALTGYETSPNGVSILKEYDLVSAKTQSLTLKKDNNVITFYYTKKEIKTDEPNLTKESTKTSINTLKDPIKYTISYYTEVEDYKGELVITLVDSLPHRIIESESTYKCTNTNEYTCTSIYDESKETITYTIKYNINTFETGKKYIIDYSMDVFLKYDETDFDGSESSIVNRITTELVADQTKIPSYTDKEIPTDIKGTVKAKYVYLDNNEEKTIAEGKFDTTQTSKIGTSYETSKKDIPGYTFKEVRGSEKGTIKEGTIVITYVYTKDPAEVTEKPTLIKKALKDTIITSTNQEVTYLIDYSTKVKNHDGDVTLTIVDTLEYPISKVETSSEGWTASYDGNKTITFTKKYHIHTSLVDTNEVEIEELLSYTVKYKTFAAENDSDDKLTNKAKPSITILKETTTGDEVKEDVPINVLGNVKINYLERDTNKVLHTSTYLYENDIKVGTSYETKSLTINGYKVVSNSGNTTGIVKEKLTEVTYYYERLSATPENPILTKTGTTSITSTDQKVKYNLTYEAKISGYKGDVVITMIDKLPYPIDINNSKISGEYTYDETNNTITWIIFEESNIEPTQEIPITFIENLELVYIGIPANGKSFTNTVEIHIEDGTSDDHVEKEDHKTDIDINGKVVVRHLDDRTGKEITEVSPESITGKVGTAYETKPATINGYTLVSEKLPDNDKGNFIDGTINVTYRYKKIDISLTDEEVTKTSSTTKVTSKNQNVDYEINYNAFVEYRGTITVTVVDQLEYPIDVSQSKLSGGTYDKDKLTITWTEKIDNLNTYLTGTKHHVSIQKIISLRYKNIPSNGTITNSVTGYIKTNEGKTNDTTPDEVVIPTNIKGNLIVEYIYIAENGEIKELHSYSEEDYVGETYTTEAKTFNSYTLKEIPTNASGKIVEGTTRVTYFYTKIPAEVKENKVDKESTKDVITNTKDNFDYTIVYNTEIDEYIGKATITIVDELTHPIDADKSKLNGGIYNEEKLTITWTKEYDVNTYENINNKININIEISLYYKNLKATDRVVENNVSTKLVIDTIKEPVETTDKEETKLEVPGKVIVNYVDEFNKVIANQETIKGLVGDTYKTNSKEIDGYILSKVQGNENGTYTEEDIVVTYIYEKEGTGTVKPPHTLANTNLLSIILISLLALLISIKRVIKL